MRLLDPFRLIVGKRSLENFDAIVVSKSFLGPRNMEILVLVVETEVLER